jgi:Xaa-Pro aminopeptidase
VLVVRAGGDAKADVYQCPIQTKLVMVELLSPAERQWLNNYHAETMAKLSRVLEKFGDERALRWLEKECEAI